MLIRPGDRDVEQRAGDGLRDETKLMRRGASIGFELLHHGVPTVDMKPDLVFVTRGLRLGQNYQRVSAHAVELHGVSAGLRFHC